VVPNNLIYLQDFFSRFSKLPSHFSGAKNPNLWVKSGNYFLAIPTHQTHCGPPPSIHWLSGAVLCCRYRCPKPTGYTPNPRMVSPTTPIAPIAAPPPSSPHWSPTDIATSPLVGARRPSHGCPSWERSHRPSATRAAAPFEPANLELRLAASAQFASQMTPLSPDRAIPEGGGLGSHLGLPPQLYVQ
jgi:hypothetical protein